MSSKKITSDKVDKLESLKSIQSTIYPNVNIYSTPHDKYSTSTGISIISAIFSLIVTLFILGWLTNMSKCKCANINEGLYLKEWFIFRSVWIIVGLIMYIANEANYNNYPYIWSFFAVIITIIDIVMIVRLFLYIRKLRMMQCDCGLTEEQNAIYYYLIIIFAIVVISMIISLLSMLFASIA